MKCPKCGIEYEGSICPICGESSTLSLKKRSNRKIKILGTVAFVFAALLVISGTAFAAIKVDRNISKNKQIQENLSSNSFVTSECSSFINENFDNVQSKPINATNEFVGEWEQSNKNSEDSYQVATITNDTIEIYWIFDGGKTKSLYWAGTFELPTSSGNSFTWVSKSNTEKASQSVMASQDGTKTFTYQDGKISYQVSALGNTTTVELQKQ